MNLRLTGAKGGMEYIVSLYIAPFINPSYILVHRRGRAECAPSPFKDTEWSHKKICKKTLFINN